MSSCAFEYGTEAGVYTKTAPCSSPHEVSKADPLTGNVPVAVSANVTGLTPTVLYHYRLVAANANGPESGQDQGFVGPGLAIDGESVLQATATTARLAAQLNPNGVATEYHFQYITEAAFDANGGSFEGSEHPVDVPETDGSAGAGVGDVALSVPVAGLLPGTTYHYRVVAVNPLTPGGIAGADHTFTTQGTATAGLIDGRSWELVSPPDKHGASLEMSTEEAGLFQAAQDGSALTYFAEAPITPSPAGARSFAYSQLLSKRGGAGGGWSTKDITTPEESVEGLISGGGLTEYKQFSSDLSTALVEPQGATPLSPPLSAAESGHQERTPYLRQNTAGAAGEYLPLLTHANILPGVKFGGKEEEPRPEEQPGVGGAGFEGGTQFVAGTADLSHVVLSAPLVLTKEFKAGFTDEAKDSSLYEWSAGRTAGEQLQLVSILPNGPPAAEDGQASNLGNQNNGLRGAISSDGERVVFESAHEEQEHHLYLRDLSLGRTVQLDAVQPGTVNPGTEKPVFVDATPDGSKVFFLDTQQLTEDSTANGANPDLYMCEVPLPAPGGRLECKLKDLTVPLHAGEHANVLGADLGIDETGTYVYFVATGVLASGATGQGAPNLYVQDTRSGQTRLVATLSSDGPDWRQNGEVSKEFKGMTSRVSANGRYVAFMSQRSLTGYDNEDVTSQAPGERMDEEVFLYHAPAPEDLAAEPGTLTCVSCDPTGARPDGVLDLPLAGGLELALLVDRPGVWAGRWLAGSLPSWPKIDNRHALYQPRNLDNDGRLFFDSADALVPQDQNGKEDVYEYEPQGTGGCGLAEGCVGLISSGTSNEESAFIDASGMGPGGEEGEDVFFMTAAQLAPQDTDKALDVYDAHVCSTVTPCPAGVTNVPPVCTTADSCRAAPAPQPDIFGAPATATLSGAGNPVSQPGGRASNQKKIAKKKTVKCPKGRVRKHGKCVRRKASHRRGRR